MEISEIDELFKSDVTIFCRLSAPIYECQTPSTKRQAQAPTLNMLTVVAKININCNKLLISINDKFIAMTF
jgi:hypothetical protein